MEEFGLGGLNIGFDEELKALNMIQSPSSRMFVLDKDASIKGIDSYDYVAECVLPRAHPNQGVVDHKNTWLTEQTLEFINILYVFYKDAKQNNHEWMQQLCDKENGKLGFPTNLSFKWRNPETKKLVDVNAKKFIDNSFDLIESIIEDKSKFPTEKTKPFPVNFIDNLKVIYKLMYKVYSIILLNDCLKSQLNSDTLLHHFKRFTCFTLVWNVADFPPFLKTYRYIKDEILAVIT